MLPSTKKSKYNSTHHSREVDHLEQVGRGLVFVLLHPGTAHQLRGPDCSEQVKLQQCHLSRYLHWVQLDGRSTQVSKAIKRVCMHERELSEDDSDDINTSNYNNNGTYLLV